MDRNAQRWLIAPSMMLGWILGGCASQGPLRPPSLDLPAPVRHLEAKRIGGRVELSWTTPASTTDGVSLTAHRHNAGALTAEICRTEGMPSGTCTPFKRLQVSAGAATNISDLLPRELASGPPRALYYSVRVVNAKGKGAGWTRITTAAGAAPEPLRNLQASPVASGILLRWQAGEGDAMFRVSRGADEAKSSLLRIEGAQSLGGTLDTGGRAGQEQRYVGLRQRTVQLASESVEVQSDPVSVTVPANAKLPLPAAPTNLEALANTLGPPEIDLVWQPPDDLSVTGYRVFRQEGSGEAVLLTPQPVTGFTFTDKTAQSGRHYTYRVSAVNPSGESAATRTTAALP